MPVVGLVNEHCSSCVYLTEECGDNRKENKLQEDIIIVKNSPVGHVGFFAHNNNVTPVAVVSLIFSVSFEIKFVLWFQFKYMCLLSDYC